jgi:56kDa selenium binding protein (SBP56)
MLQLSDDGCRRVYVTNSLYSTRDNQFDLELRSSLLRINCEPDGGMEIDQNFSVDVHDRPGGPARGHATIMWAGGLPAFLAALLAPGPMSVQITPRPSRRLSRSQLTPPTAADP